MSLLDIYESKVSALHNGRSSKLSVVVDFNSTHLLLLKSLLQSVFDVESSQLYCQNIQTYLQEEGIKSLEESKLQSYLTTFAGLSERAEVRKNQLMQSAKLSKPATGFLFAPQPVVQSEQMDSNVLAANQILRQMLVLTKQLNLRVAGQKALRDEVAESVATLMQQGATRSGDAPLSVSALNEKSMQATAAVSLSQKLLRDLDQSIERHRLRNAQLSSLFRKSKSNK